MKTSHVWKVDYEYVVVQRDNESGIEDKICSGSIAKKNVVTKDIYFLGARQAIESYHERHCYRPDLENSTIKAYVSVSSFSYLGEAIQEV